MIVPDLPIGPKVEDRPASLPDRVTLTGRFAAVTPLNPGLHADPLFQAIGGHDELWTYLASGPFSTRDALELYLQSMAKRSDPLAFTILDHDGKAVGLAAYLRIEPGNRVIEVGHLVFTPELQRSSAATEAMYLMARYAFEQLGYRRYEWKCNAFNAASRRAALRLGFQFEGIFRQHMIVKGRNRDTAWFSILDSEWPVCKSAFEAWLDASNFDETGRQKKSLAALREQFAVPTEVKLPK